MNYSLPRSMTESSQFQKLGLQNALRHPFFQALGERASRRFPLGCELEVPGGKFVSKHPPIALTEEEEALLVWSATGIAGQTLHDTSPVLPGYSMQLHWSRRTWPSSAAAHCTQLFVLNDSGIWYLDVRGYDSNKIEEDFSTAETPEKKLDAALAFYRQFRKRLSNNREDVPSKFPSVWKGNEWFFNKPGTTLFIPVTDFTIEYINVVSFMMGQGWRFNIVDDFHDNRSAGLEKWVKNGKLASGVKIQLRLLEFNTGLSIGAEQGFMLQNVGLAAQALGLGGFAFAGHLPQVVMGGTPAARGLGFKFITPNKEPKTPFAVGRADFLKIYHPYWYDGSVESMIHSFFDARLRKFKEQCPKPFKDQTDWLGPVGYPDYDDIQMVVDYFQYIWDTFGRLPVLLEPMSTRIFYQAHHLELDFYDKYYPKGAYTQSCKDHFRLWHPQMRDPFSST